MPDNLRYKTLIGVALAGVGLLTITAVPSWAHSNDEMKENSPSYLSRGENISNRNYQGRGFELSNGQTSFKRSPHLIRAIRATTTQKGRNIRGATYYFTIEVPNDAGAALKAIRIEQRDNFGEMIAFKPQENRAVIGDTFAGGKPLSLAAVGGEQESAGSVTVVFARPVSPGNTVTVAVKPRLEHGLGGVYLFGVTAYPEGGESRGLYLGVGRFHLRNY